MCSQSIESTYYCVGRHNWTRDDEGEESAEPFFCIKIEGSVVAIWWGERGGRAYYVTPDLGYDNERAAQEGRRKKMGWERTQYTPAMGGTFRPKHLRLEVST